MTWEVLEAASAPPESRESLRAAREKYGFVPNLLGVMAHSPQLLRAYQFLSGEFSNTTLSPIEQQVVLLVVSVSNRCEYCVAAHSMSARMHHTPDDVVQAIRSGQPTGNARLDALRSLAEEIVDSRGWPKQKEIDRFLQAGFGSQQVLEVILAIGLKTLSNYTNHVAHTPLDPVFGPSRWSPLPAAR